MSVSGLPIDAKNLLIRASAGSGKTYQLSNRIIRLLGIGAPPESVVALTFTRKAAGEFADALLEKLAKAACDPASAARLAAETGLEHPDFTQMLARVVARLHSITLGTMDSFFASVVRAWQIELGIAGGRFQLVEGQQAEAATTAILADLLGRALDEQRADDFLHAFRRAVGGKENAGVARATRDFVRYWYGLYLEPGHGGEWGPHLPGAGVDPLTWEKRKHELLDEAERVTAEIDFTDKRQDNAMGIWIDSLRRHTIGSGVAKTGDSIGATLLKSLAEDSGPLTFKLYKDCTLPPMADQLWREILGLLVSCEMEAELRRTRAVREVVAAYAEERERRLCRRGMLGFDDLKRLMSEWAESEDARLRREAVDFRLDQRLRHWLLDEFQDTSTGQWTGLRPLLDEAAADEEGSLFIVGDAKQAVYGWRGGDVRLFRTVLEQYGGGMTEAPMDESFRSCPVVLDLVNRVCGDTASLARHFGESVAQRWRESWQPHQSARHLLDKRGEARVEILEKDADHAERVIEILEERAVGRRDFTCGVLVRRNAEVKEMAAALRARGFDVIEEGERAPAADNPVGVAICQMLRWLADPGDLRAFGVLEMSPLWPALSAGCEGGRRQVWSRLLERAAALGFAGMVAELVAEHGKDWSAFSHRRAGDIVAALAALDAAGGTSPREAARAVEDLRVRQSPGIAAVQVMTIHKAKGLGFDLVVLPSVPEKRVPEMNFFKIARGPGWVSGTPAQWVWQNFPEFADAAQEWIETQRYEALCLFYVALTRAKRSLVALIKQPSDGETKRPPEENPSMSAYLRTCLGGDYEPGVLSAEGGPEWIEDFKVAGDAPPVSPAPVLGEARRRRAQARPSAEGEGGAASGAGHVAVSPGGMAFGTRVHAAFEAVGWLEDGLPVFDDREAGAVVRNTLAVFEIARLFTRPAGDCVLYREQSFDFLDESGRWISGVIDRLHVHREMGRAVRAEVIDFKTDRMDEAEALCERHAGQMHAYRAAVAKALDLEPAAVRVFLIGTHGGALAEVEG